MKHCETERINEDGDSALLLVSLSQSHCAQLNTCSSHLIARSLLQLLPNLAATSTASKTGTETIFIWPFCRRLLDACSVEVPAPSLS
jgi:predicted pyridoxine 5'-phosphate oxidase superfamily flavin-nucleotide-binding protein